MPRRQLTFPEVPPLALAQARAHVRERSQAFDSEILSTLAAVIALQQAKFNRQFITADYELQIDSFPAGSCPIPLPPTPLAAVEVVTYTDPDGIVRTWDAAEYEVRNVLFDRAPGFLLPIAGATYPTGTNVEVFYSCGHGLEWADVPDEFKQVIMTRTDEMYRRRDYGDDIKILERCMMVGDVLETYA